MTGDERSEPLVIAFWGFAALAPGAPKSGRDEVLPVQFGHAEFVQDFLGLV